MIVDTLNPLIDRQEVCRRLGVGLTKVRQLERAGVLPAVRLGARCVRYRPQDVAAIVERLRAGIIQ